MAKKNWNSCAEAVVNPVLVPLISTCWGIFLFYCSAISQVSGSLTTFAPGAVQTRSRGTDPDAKSLSLYKAYD